MESFGFPGSQFPPGFRFHPTDQELIIHYLSRKLASAPTPATSIIADVDIYKFDPWELPGQAFFGEGEWFFFSPRDRKYPNGARPNRAAGCGYWKATGTDKPILAAGGSKCLGVKKALVFYKGRPPKGTKTDWVMHEYRLLDDKSSSWSQKHRGSMRLDEWVLCRVRQKGNMPTENSDEIENKFSTNSRMSHNSRQEKALGENSNSWYGWNEHQLLAYLTSYQEEGRASTPESDYSESESIGGAAAYSYVPYFPQTQHVSSVLESIKRKLSFGALDELILQSPSKRFHFARDLSEQSSPTTSSSPVDQVFPEFVF